MASLHLNRENLSFNINLLKDKFHYKTELLKAEFLSPSNNYNSGLKIQNKYSEVIDKIIQKAADIRFDISPAGHVPAIVALGGYGRKELAPYSDIDLAFVYEAPLTSQAKKCIEAFSADLWTIGIKISTSVRTLQECETWMSEDILFLTSLLEKRWVWGPKTIYQKLDKSFQHHIASLPPGVFISAKLKERDQRHQKMGNSRYYLEPNIKEGKGALRDIHTLLWIGNFLYGIRKPDDLVKKNVLTPKEAATLQHALHFFWTIRCHLHFLSNRADDRLSFDNQPRIAALTGYKDPEPNIRAEKFMKDYFLLAKEVGHLTRIICADIEAKSMSGNATAGSKKMVLQDSVEQFPVKSNRLTVEDSHYFKKFPSEIIRIFRVKQTSGIDIHPDALRAIRRHLSKLTPELRRSAEAHRLFLEILLDPRQAERTLRLMNEADVLGALLPDFNNIAAHMQYDMYHVFTADEHTIRAVGMLHKLENNTLVETAPFVCALFPKIHSRRALYTAMFLHDIAKGTEGKNHSQKGSDIALTLCPRLGLTPEETETVAWLVQEHLTMTLTAFKRDLDDHKTIQDFVAVVQSPERLKLLTLLTTADIMAVGPELWNNWKAGLLAELYQKASGLMAGENIIVTPFPTAKKTTTPENTLIKIVPYPKHDYTEVTICAPDKKGLFATLSGAMAAAGASIANARIFTQNDGTAIDVFHIQDMKGRVYENTTFLNRTLKAALEGKIDLAAEIRERQKNTPKKSKLFQVAPRVIIDNNASISSTVIEVNGKDRPGFLYDMTSVLSQQGLQIAAAKITTFGSRAVDVFYVKDSFGLKIVHPDRLQAIENSLKQMLEKSL